MAAFLRLPAFPLIATLSLAGLPPALAHDPYSGLRDPMGRLCCGGDDCEAIETYEVHPDGSVSLFSKRFHLSVDVPAANITWLAIPGGTVHWCGALSYRSDPIVRPSLTTFCAFIDPGNS